MDSDALREDQPQRLKEFASGGWKGKPGRALTIAGFLNALLLLARSGARWRDLPEQFGTYETVKRRYYWCVEMHVLDGFLGALASRSRSGVVMIDSTIVRAHRTPAKSGADTQGLGRFPRSTKIHTACDALGNPARLIGSPGKRNDIAFAHELADGFAADVMIANKGYNADHLCDRIAETGGEVVIPPKQPDCEASLRLRPLQRAQHN